MRSRLAKLWEEIISIEVVMTSQIVRHDVKIWWRPISVKNIRIALKVCRLSWIGITIICITIWDFSLIRWWFTKIAPFADAKRLILLLVKFQSYVISNSWQTLKVMRLDSRYNYSYLVMCKAMYPPLGFRKILLPSFFYPTQT